MMTEHPYNSMGTEYRAKLRLIKVWRKMNNTTLKLNQYNLVLEPEIIWFEFDKSICKVKSSLFVYNKSRLASSTNPLGHGVLIEKIVHFESSIKPRTLYM